MSSSRFSTATSPSRALLGLALAAAAIALVACGGGSKSPSPGGTATDQTRPATSASAPASGSEPPTEEFGMTETQLVTNIERGEGLVSGLYPSLRAARMEPVEALRSGT